MKLLLAAFVVLLAASDARPHNQEDVPAPPAVQQNAIPRDLPPATPPIPPTSRSADAPRRPRLRRHVETNPQHRQVPVAPQPDPIPR